MQNTHEEDGWLTGKMVHLALPVRWSRIGERGRGLAETACTYDIHPHGARLLSARQVSVGDLVLIERARSRVVCQVVWSADPKSALRGQFSVKCVDEGKTPWDEELRQIEEQYEPVILDGASRAGRSSFDDHNSNRRRRPRFSVEGQAKVIDGTQRAAGEVRQISEYGALIQTSDGLGPGTDFRLLLNLFDICVAVKAQVKNLVGELGMGVEFQEIRRGDRPLLSYILSKLRTSRVEEFAELEVVVEPLAAVAR